LNREQFLHWLNQVYSTREAEIGCDRLQEVLPTFVDLEVTGQPLPEELAEEVRSHLTHCPDCAEEYAGLLALARLEAQGRLPENEASLSGFDTLEPA
jgi:predicted anti-sigma-YlaC factor YlaD